MTRVFNFSAGPAALPVEVLEQLRDEMLDWHGHGMSVMEMSHRGKAYVGIAQQAEADLRELMAVPANYKVLFLQGGATAQFAAIPLNLTAPGAVVDYVNTGTWSKKAIAEAKRYCKVNVAADASATKFTTVPAEAGWQRSPDGGLPALHAERDHPRRRVPVRARDPRHPARRGPVVHDPVAPDRRQPVRRDLCRRAEEHRPGRPRGRHRARRPARQGTPRHTHRVRLEGDGRRRLDAQHAGDLFVVRRRPRVPVDQAPGRPRGDGRLNQAKARKLYDAIDASGFYRNPVAVECRSWMNVPFTLPDAALDKPFADGAKQAGLVALEGHRSVGGMRASIYNAMPMAGVDALVEYMREFQRSDGGWRCVQDPDPQQHLGARPRAAAARSLRSRVRDRCGPDAIAGALGRHARDRDSGERAGRGQARARAPTTSPSRS